MSVGEPVCELDTPALIIDLDVLEENIRRMADVFRRNNVGWRPHTKAIKIPALAHKLIAAGAFGVTVAKVSEAEVMAQAGIHDILITGQVAAYKKQLRLASLALWADPIAVVDCVEQVEGLDKAAAAVGSRPRVVIEVDTGMHRCGVQPGEPVVALAKEIAKRKHLRFVGVMAWEGHTLRVTPIEEKERQVREAIALQVDSAERCRAAGLEVSVVSCGGTGTYPLSAQQPGITEIEAGGGIYGDMQYNSFGIPHPHAMTVLATVISRPNPTRIVTDAGFKSLGTAQALPQPKGIENVQVVKFSAEHGTIELTAPSATPKVGDLVEWFVGYTDSTVPLHDVMYAARKGRVEAAWPILGRGKLQ
ncbi:MAG: DSD1 family PLP-dependent enzyme [Chloroflexota bacterium]